MLFSQVSGRLDGSLRRGVVPGPEGKVVVSHLSAGSAASVPALRLGLKYVASGAEVYRYGGRTYGVSAGQFMIVPALTDGDVEIGRSSDGAAHGLCVYLPEVWEGPASGLDTPMLFPAKCSALGRLLAAAHASLRRAPRDAPAMAGALLARAAGDVEPLIEETVAQLDGLGSLRPATRYELLRRLNVARAYLHAVTDRPVELAELAAVAATSRFHLLRNFRNCFGAPPAAYHRRVRLEAARAAIAGRRMSCAEAAQRFGFADSSSFSHAFRRTFGRAPSQLRGGSPHSAP